ncbi:hypothetical protein D3C81_805320 [compost metagenome]
MSSDPVFRSSWPALKVPRTFDRACPLPAAVTDSRPVVVTSAISVTTLPAVAFKVIAAPPVWLPLRSMAAACMLVLPAAKFWPWAAIACVAVSCN